MNYYFNTTVDCKACLDLILSNLKSKCKGNLLYKENQRGCEIIVNCSESITNVKKSMIENAPAPFDIVEERKMTVDQYEKTHVEFEVYKNSFWFDDT